MRIQYKIFKLKNNLRVLLLKRPERYSAAASLLINAGSIYENKRTSGISHFFEHMFYTGCKNYPTEELLRKRSQEIALAASASTDVARIELYGSFPKKEIKNSLLILKEMAFESLLTPAMIEKERTIILNEERLREDSNFQKLWRIAMINRFHKNCPLQLPVVGTPETISKITKFQLINFYKKHCRTANSTLVIASSVEFKRLRQIVKSVFEDSSKGQKIKPPIINKNHMTDFSTTTFLKDTKQIYLQLNFPTYPGEDLYKAWQYGFVQILLSEGLNQTLRIDKGLVYDLKVRSVKLTKKISLLYIETNCDPENLRKVLTAIFQKINSIKEGNLDIELFERTRETGNKTLPMRFDSLDGAIDWCIQDFSERGKVSSPEEVILARNKVTKNDLEKAAKSLFNYHKLNIAILGPVQKSDLEKIISKSFDKR
ncbi:MAG: pitrilysin family protein [bacterium]|nr:pitrilysin family protein [bacterium]